MQEKISNRLSKHQVRSWCIYEWFYSAIDYPWFAKREFVEYLYHVGLGHVPRLTRVEWGVIRRYTAQLSFNLEVTLLSLFPGQVLNIWGLLFIC